MPDNPLLILVVDDRIEVARSLAELLLAEGHRVEVAAGGFEGLSKIQRHLTADDPVHLVVAAIDMVGMDGLGMLATLRKRGARPEFALISSSSAPPIDVVSAARAQGCDQILVRPWKQAQVQELLRLAAARRAGHPVERTPDAGQPFFGTTRVLRSSRRATEDGTAPPPAAPAPSIPPTALPDAPLTAPALPPLPTPPPIARPATQRIRRIPSEIIAPELLGEDTPGGATLIPRPPSGEQRPTSGAVRTLPCTSPTPGTGTTRRPLPPPDSSAAGTGRLARPGMPLAPDTASIRRSPPPTPDQGIPRTRSDPFIASRPANPGETTARIRRGVDGGRPDTGAHAAPSPTAITRPFTCPLCGQIFQAPLRTAAFTTVCVHCGQMVRIPPA